MIEFSGVYKKYANGTEALKDVNIHIEDGEFVYIVGASGAGKSTFLKLIMREETATAGEVIVNNYKLSRLKRRHIPYLRRTMGVVFQDFRLINTMTVFDNVGFAMRVTGASRREIRNRVRYVLRLVGLLDKAHRFPPELSGGEQQRVGLARALVNNPSLIIADEPTGNVDPERAKDIVELLTEINRRGTTVLMVTHEMSLVNRFPNRTITIRDGAVVSDTGNNMPVSGQASVKLGGEA
jgi:cell division transport system ATP-binding protein